MKLISTVCEIRGVVKRRWSVMAPPRANGRESPTGSDDEERSAGARPVSRGGGVHQMIIPNERRRQALLAAQRREEQLLSRPSPSGGWTGGSGAVGGGATPAGDVNMARLHHQRIRKEERERLARRETAERERKLAEQAEIDAHRQEQRRKAERIQRQEAAAATEVRRAARAHWTGHAGRSLPQQGGGNGSGLTREDEDPVLVRAIQESLEVAERQQPGHARAEAIAPSMEDDIVRRVAEESLREQEDLQTALALSLADSPQATHMPGSHGAGRGDVRSGAAAALASRERAAASDAGPSTPAFCWHCGDDRQGVSTPFCTECASPSQVPADGLVRFCPHCGKAVEVCSDAVSMHVPRDVS